MTSSGPIHHSRFPAQQGQAALLAVTTAYSLAHFTQAAGERDPSTPAPRGKRGTGFSRFHFKTQCVCPLSALACAAAGINAEKQLLS